MFNPKRQRKSHLKTIFVPLSTYIFSPQYDIFSYIIFHINMNWFAWLKFETIAAYLNILAPQIYSVILILLFLWQYYQNMDLYPSHRLPLTDFFVLYISWLSKRDCFLVNRSKVSYYLWYFPLLRRIQGKSNGTYFTFCFPVDMSVFGEYTLEITVLVLHHIISFSCIILAWRNLCAIFLHKKRWRDTVKAQSSYLKEFKIFLYCFGIRRFLANVEYESRTIHYWT